MANAFKSLDIFGVSYALKTQGQDKYKTLLGAFFTLVVMALATMFTYVYGADFFNMTNPSIFEDDFIHEEVQEVFPTTATHPFMMRVSLNNSFDLTNTPIRAELLYRHYITNKKTGLTEKYCVINEANSNCADTILKKHEQFLKEDLSTWTCIDFDKVKKQCAEITKDPGYTPFIGGNIGDDTIGQVTLSVTNEEVDNEGKIKFRSKIADFKNIGEIAVHIRYPKFYLRKEAVVNALTTKVETEGYIIVPQTYRLEHRFLKQVRLDDDTGWIDEEVETTHSIDLDKTVSQYYGNLLDKLLMLDCQVSFEKQQQHQESFVGC